jgi:hypothetical protein
VSSPRQGSGEMRDRRSGQPYNLGYCLLAVTLLAVT